ncbi:MAG TPA: phosphoglycolate phosphatase [Alphaproteobacteria bacterium]|nr:phosphoglycolate phosphatase [Alphaproteobacteria bacterium]
MRHPRTPFEEIPSIRPPDGHKFRAVVFDLDGTLIDSAPDIHRALNRTLAEAGRGGVTLDEVKRMIGDGAERLVERGFAATGKAVDGAALHQSYKRFLSYYEGPDAAGLTLPYPGVPETLERLQRQGLRLGICTNKPERSTVDVLRQLDLEKYFLAVVTPEHAPAHKPHPAHLLAVLSRLGAAQTESVMVGDSANDVATARRAGVPVIAVSYGYPRTAPEALGADLLIDRMAALPDALRHLG